MAADGEVLFEAAWLSCHLSASMKADEAFVSIPGAFTAEPPSFFVARSLVRPEPPTTAEVVEGEVKVTLLYRHNGRSTVEVSGEPLSFGPRIDVPTASLG